MPLYMGIDSGGTKTDCMVGDERRDLGTATGGSSKLARVGKAKARAVLQEVIRGALRGAGGRAAGVHHVCIGMAGASHPAAVAAMRGIVQKLVPGAAVTVVGDHVIALEAAFAGGPGMVVGAGTGSFAFGRNEQGKTARAGGWGPQASDEGSGHWIGRAAVGALFRAQDSGQQTALTPLVCRTWGVEEIHELAQMANSAEPAADFAALFPAVLAASEAADPVARDILMRAGVELGQLARLVARRLWPEEQRFRVAVCGGVFQNAQMVRQVFANTVKAERREADVVAEPVQPVRGAISLAREAEPVAAAKRAQ